MHRHRRDANAERNCNGDFNRHLHYDRNRDNHRNLDFVEYADRDGNLYQDCHRNVDSDCDGDRDPDRNGDFVEYPDCDSNFDQDRNVDGDFVEYRDRDSNLDQDGDVDGDFNLNFNSDCYTDGNGDTGTAGRRRADRGRRPGRIARRHYPAVHFDYLDGRSRGLRDPAGRVRGSGLAEHLARSDGNRGGVA